MFGTQQERSLKSGRQLPKLRCAGRHPQGCRRHRALPFLRNLGRRPAGSAGGARGSPDHLADRDQVSDGGDLAAARPDSGSIDRRRRHRDGRHWNRRTGPRPGRGHERHRPRGPGAARALPSVARASGRASSRTRAASAWTATATSTSANTRAVACRSSIRKGSFVTQWFADREFPLTGMAVRRDGVVLTVQRGEIVLRDGYHRPIARIDRIQGGE